ncbi:hypothetical protein GGR43_000706 [Sphingobium jiangsuense]|uniref:Uncharacterized protein n=1 Tax=Sphingobium jiangsuense TaxID=870476 RepID=A0A7W6FNR4_9SPHN|nr:hypothetical protein [Sphingobium jiangsuense]MBB3925005.1 hypothetical protein [Sphingobium jiangsuense]
MTKNERLIWVKSGRATSVRLELVDPKSDRRPMAAFLFGQEGQGFDKLSPNGFLYRPYVSTLGRNHAFGMVVSILRRFPMRFLIPLR